MHKALIQGAAALVLALTLAACAGGGAGAPAPVLAAPTAPDPATLLADPQRFPGDEAQDARRRAAETLAFMAVRPGDIVFEIEAGGGYWTELLSAIVGPQGQVIMQNPPGFLAFVKADLAARFAPGRLANVRMSLSAFDRLDAADGSADVATWVQGPHELYFKPQGGASLGDPAASYAEIVRILKPGGRLIVIDHAAAAGAPREVGDSLHRIDKAVVIEMAEAAGLRLSDQADFLANPDDPRSAPVFDPAIRGRTDQFVLAFEKPAP